MDPAGYADDVIVNADGPAEQYKMVPIAEWERMRSIIRELEVELRAYIETEELTGKPGDGELHKRIRELEASRDGWKAACNTDSAIIDAVWAVLQEKEGTLEGHPLAKKVKEMRDRIRELETFLRSTFDDEDITPTSLEFWSSEYKHAMRQLADAGKKDQRIRDLEAELARVQAEAAAMRKVMERPVQLGYGLLRRYMCHACCRAWSPGDQQTHEDDCVLTRTTAGRYLLERLSRYESALKFYACPNHVPDGPTLDVCREYCRMANEALANKQTP